MINFGFASINSERSEHCFLLIFLVCSQSLAMGALVAERCPNKNDIIFISVPFAVSGLGASREYLGGQ